MRCGGEAVGLEPAKIIPPRLRRVFQAGFRGLRRGGRWVVLAYR